MAPRGTALPRAGSPSNLPPVLGDPYAGAGRESHVNLGGPAGPQGMRPPGSGEPVLDLHAQPPNHPAGAHSSCSVSLAQPAVTRRASNEREIVQDLHQWVTHSGVTREVAVQVLYALRACRNDADCRLDLSALSAPGLPRGSPLPDLSIIVPHARSINLDGNNLTAVPLSLLRLSELTELSLGNNLIAQFPEELCDMASLLHLDLRNNDITELPQGMGRSGLVTLQVPYCRLSALPEGMGEMPRLRALWIGGNPDLAAVPASLANLPPDCQIYVNREQPFRPQDVMLPAEVVFAEDTDTDMDDPDAVPPLHEGVAAWRQALPEAAAGPSSRPRESPGPDPWVGLGEGDGAPSFAVWLHRMHATAGGNSAEVAFGMEALLRRMQDQPEFRRQCFALAVNALNFCEDRVAVGYDQMQVALLTSRATAGELSPAQLRVASLQVFNRNVLREFAVAHAERVRVQSEELEVALALETRLRGRLALPEGVPGMTNADFAQSGGRVTDRLVEQALAHVHARQREPGPGGFRHFLAGQDSTEFTAWVDHLRSRYGDEFDALNDKVQAKHQEVAEAFGGTPEADLQAGIESKMLYSQALTELVWRLTQRSSAQEASGSGVPAHPVAAFPAAAAGRARERSQRGDEPRPHSPRSASPAFPTRPTASPR
jgi:hypothetical protein